METSNIANPEFGRAFALTHITKCLVDLLDRTLVDAATAIEAAAGDLRTSDTILGRPPSRSRPSFLRRMGIESN